MKTTMTVTQPSAAESLMLRQLTEARAMYLDGLRKLSFMEPNSELLQILSNGGAVPSLVQRPVAPAIIPPAGLLSQVHPDKSPMSGLDLLHAVSVAQDGEAPVAAPSASGLEETSTPKATAANTESVKPKPSAPKTEVKTDEDGRPYVMSVSDLDVLCGRGGKSNHHPGNKRYRQVVDEIKAMYRNTTTKTVKTDLSRAIVEHVSNYGGRFVKKDEKSERYYLLSKCEARKKTSQALRETKALKWTN